MHFAHDLAWLTYAIPPLSLDADILELRYGRARAPEMAAKSCGSLVVCDLNQCGTTSAGPPPTPEVPGQGADTPMPPEIPASAFDLVVLHGALDRAPNPAAVEAGLGRSELLTTAYRALRPGGMIAVSGFNLLHPRFMRALVARWLARCFRTSGASEERASDLRSPLTYWGYVRSLRRAGYRNVQVFNVIPDYLHPQHVVSARREASAAYFRNVIEVRRANLSYPRYLFRLLLLHLNAFPYVERCYLIVAQK